MSSDDEMYSEIKNAMDSLRGKGKNPKWMIARVVGEKQREFYGVANDGVYKFHTNKEPEFLSEILYY